MAKRRSRGDGGLYWNEARQRWVAQLDVGYGGSGKVKRVRRYRKTKTDARKALADLQRTIDDGLPVEPIGYTVGEAANAWLRYGLHGRSKGTVKKNTYWVNNHIIPSLGKRKLRELTADEVDRWLVEKAAVLTTDTLRQLYSALERSVSHAQARDKVRRNVVTLCTVPKGQAGRPSKSLTREQAGAVLEAAEADASVIGDYVIVSLTTGARTDEMRGLSWPLVELPTEATAGDSSRVPVMHVYKTDRETGDTKNRWSRRSLQLPAMAVRALQRQGSRQARMRQRAGDRWKGDGLVFTTRYGSGLDHGNIRRGFKRIAGRAGLVAEDWTPRELRHSFVSLLSNHGGLDLEEISRLVGHATTKVTQQVYRMELRPRLTEGAEAMDGLFGGGDGT